jgi:SAM-dependent methyltransferase
MEATEVAKLVKLEDRHWWYRERRHLLKTMVERNLREERPGRIALDVGAAGGGNTRVLESLGFLGIALEFGAQGAELARDRGLPAIRGDARLLPLRDRSVDLVVAFDVLEHIDDDRAALIEVRRILKPGGWMFAAAPADMDLWSEHDRAVGHERRYDDGQLEALTTDAGLMVRSSRAWNVLLRPVVRLQRRKLTESHLDRVNPVLNAGLGLVIRTERFLPALHARRGVSTLVEAQNPRD